MESNFWNCHIEELFAQAEIPVLRSGAPESRLWGEAAKLDVREEQEERENVKPDQDEIPVSHSCTQARPMVCVRAFLFREESNT